MSREFDRAFYIAVSLGTAGILGLAATVMVSDIWTIWIRNAALYWSLTAISLLAVVVGLILLLVLRARLRRLIAER
jgi:glucose dehydrogenase